MGGEKIAPILEKTFNIILDKKGVLGIPCYFVQKRGPKCFVLVAEKTPQGKEMIRKREIQIGSTDFTYYEVLAGLKEGDTIIYLPPEATKSAKNQKGKPKRI